MDIYLFTDLDDTLFQTRRKCPVQSQVADLRTAALSREGHPLSLMTSKQEALFTFFDQHARIIPVTARNQDAFRRVQLPFRYEAILNYGGTILTAEGTLDKEWQKHLQSDREQAQPLLRDALSVIQTFLSQKGLNLQVRPIVEKKESEHFFYLVVKHPGLSDIQTEQKFQLLINQKNLSAAHSDYKKQLEALYHYLCEKYAGNRACRLHFNDNNLAFIPTYLNKAHAVHYFIDTYIRPRQRPFLTLGMGDSLEDLAFMKHCDYSLFPQSSQINRFCHG